MKRQRELQGAIIYSLIVAGKSAKFADRATKNFLEGLVVFGLNELPFHRIGIALSRGKLERVLRTAKTGNYRKMLRGLKELLAANIDLETCAPQELEHIYGIGPKTSRFFVLWVRPGERYAALDTHVLQWLRDMGYDAPKSTPQAGLIYDELERIFLAEADKVGWSARRLDEAIWLQYSGYEREYQAVP